MSNIRPFSADDIPEVADLYEKVVRQSGQSASTGLQDYFKEIFLDHPWYDPEMPSLVYQSAEKKILAFIGSHVRRLTLNGRKIKAACSGQLISDPDSRSQAVGAFLLKAFLDGSHEFSWTDGATDTVYPIYRRFGGELSMLNCIRWRRILKPAQFFSSKLAERPVAKPLVVASRPFSGITNALADKLSGGAFKPPRMEIPEEPLTADLVVENLPKLCPPNILHMDYDRPFLNWLFKEIARVVSRGVVISSLVRDANSHPLGWYVYYLGGDMTATVLQILTKPDGAGEVLDHLFSSAWKQGAIAVMGRVEFNICSALSDRSCLFSYWGPSMLMHAKDPEILLSIYRGDSALTWIDGEWWMGFHREAFN